MTGTIYLISDGEFFKIGRTKKDVNKRLKELQTGNPSSLQIIHSVQVKNASSVESIMHRKYDYCKQINEWFDLTSENVASFNDDCLSIDNNIEFIRESKKKMGY